MSIQTQLDHELKKKQRREDLIKYAKAHVFIYPSGSPERWRAAIKHVCVQRPEARAICNDTAAYVHERKQLFHASNLHAVAKADDGSEIRNLMSVPPFFKQALTMADPEYFMGRKSSFFSSAKHMHKMRIAFPEFVIPEVV